MSDWRPWEPCAENAMVGKWFSEFPDTPNFYLACLASLAKDARSYGEFRQGAKAITFAARHGGMGAMEYGTRLHHEIERSITGRTP